MITENLLIEFLQNIAKHINIDKNIFINQENKITDIGQFTLIIVSIEITKLMFKAMEKKGEKLSQAEY